MKLFKKIGITVFIILISGSIFIAPKIKTLYQAIHLFDHDRITENFRSMNEYWPTRTMTASDQPYVYPRKEEIQLPEEFEFRGQTINSSEFIDSSFTTGLVIIQDDTIVFENYYQGFTETTTTISWSIAKSFISALFGIAHEEGFIKNIDDLVVSYVPELKNTAYDGVTLKQVLQMSTGVEFNEDYGDFNSDINRWGRGFAIGKSQDKFAASLSRDKEPGTYNHYVSINTHVLGMIITRATGRTITDYMQEKLWTPVGMEYDAHWLMDGKEMEMVLGGLNATLRDYAKMGSVFLNNGNWRGKQIVAAEWIRMSVTPDAPHLMPGDNPNSAHPLGYGFQWWVPESDQGEFIAIGVYNQNIYVNPTTRTVIAKTSANPNFNDKSNVHSLTETHIALYRKIINAVLVKEPIPTPELVEGNSI